MVGPEERAEAADRAVGRRALSGAHSGAADRRECGARRRGDDRALEGSAKGAEETPRAREAALLRLQHRVAHFMTRERRGLTLQTRQHDEAEGKDMKWNNLGVSQQARAQV